MVQLRFGYHQRRRYLERITRDDPADQSVVSDRAAGTGGERRIGGESVGVEYQGSQQPDAAAVTSDQAMIGQVLHQFDEPRLERQDPSGQPFALHDVEVGDRRRGDGRMSGVGVPVSQHGCARCEEWCGDSRGGDDPSQREVSARHSLGEGDQIGLEREAIRSEPVANPAEAGDDLVGDEEGPRSFDGRLGLLEVAIRCGPHAARTDHRFAVEPAILSAPISEMAFRSASVESHSTLVTLGISGPYPTLFPSIPARLVPPRRACRGTPTPW